MTWPVILERVLGFAMSIIFVLVVMSDLCFHLFLMADLSCILFVTTNLILILTFVRDKLTLRKVAPSRPLKAFFLTPLSHKFCSVCIWIVDAILPEEVVDGLLVPVRPRIGWRSGAGRDNGRA